MKLESLKSSKFEAFKGNELLNAFAIIGGVRQNTSQNGQLMDSVDCDTSDTPEKAISKSCPRPHDWYDTICPVGPSEGQGGIIQNPTPVPVGGGQIEWHYNDLNM